MLGSRIAVPLQILLSLSVAIVLIASPLYVIVHPAYPGFQYRLPGFPPSLRFTTPERTRLAETIWRYTRGSVPLEEMAGMETDSGAIALLPSETQHLVDVKTVVQGFYLAHGIGLLLAVVCGAALYRSARARLVGGLTWGTGLALGLLALIGISALINFDVFFTLFHGVFFDAGTWTFAYEDTLIQLYPLEFWTNAVMHYLAVIAVLAALVLAGARTIGRRLAQESAA